jgi:hypothetical protein
LDQLWYKEMERPVVIIYSIKWTCEATDIERACINAVGQGDVRIF